MNPTHGGVCNCYVSFLTCIKSTNCLTPQQYKLQEQACERAMVCFFFSFVFFLIFFF